MNTQTAQDKPILTDEEYVAKAGNACPVCHENMTHGGDLEVAGRTASQSVTCLLCGATWADVYQLVGYSDLEK